MINAIRLYRIARWLYLHHIPFLPKLLQLITFNVSIVGQGPYKECPRIGNNVYIGSGVVIQGPVIIEDNVIIAPNAVVNKSVHTNMIVGGIPAKIIGDVTKLDYDIFANESWKEGHKPFLT